MTTGIVWHECYAPNNIAADAILPTSGYVHWNGLDEDAEAAQRFYDLLGTSKLLDHLVCITPRLATEEDVLRFHTEKYVERVKKSSRLGERVGAIRGRGCYELALTAAGGVIAAVDAVLLGEVDNAYALVCPSGHHAVPNDAQGACIFGNAVIAGRYALSAYGLARIAFVDWDVHHGSGTEVGFWDDPTGLTISIHQDRYFPPDRGLVHHWGEGAGEGYNINIPLPAGSGDGAYLAAFEQVVIPALYGYNPDLIIVPSGFGGGAFDPRGRNMMTSEGFRKLTSMVKRAARDLCKGRLVLCHEGGSSSATVPFLGLAVMEELAGLRMNVNDPFLATADGFAGQPLQQHQKAVIQQSRYVLNRAILGS